MDDIHYSCIHVIYVSHLFPVESALHNVHDIFRLKMTLVFNFSDACHNFKTGNISSTRHVYAASW